LVVAVFAVAVAVAVVAVAVVAVAAVLRKLLATYWTLKKVTTTPAPTTVVLSIWTGMRMLLLAGR
jgi:hypothetical protein